MASSSRVSDYEDDIGSSSLESRKYLIDEILHFKRSDDDLFKMPDDGSEISVLSLPFSNDSSVELHTRLLEEGTTCFSSIYLNTMKQVDEETQDLSPPCSSCSLCSSCTTDTWEILGIDEDDLFIGPEDLKPEEKEEYETLLKETNLSNFYPDAGDEGIGKVKFQDKKKRKKKKDFDSMSGIWKMLSTYDDFFISPPGYNLYQQGKPHWLDREFVPWAVRERSRSKCADWLHRYHK